MAIGVFIGVTPTIPFHTVLILFLIFLSRQNLTAALLGAWITNPVTIPFFYLTEYEIGKFILGWDQYRGLLTEYNVHQLLKMGWEILGPLQIGGLILAPLFAVPTYFVTHKAVLAVRRRGTNGECERTAQKI